MQHLKIISAIVVSSCLLLACSGNNSSSTGKVNVADTVAVSGTTSHGDASFSATVDGTTISGKEIDEMQIQNTAFIYPPQNNKPQTVLFLLYSTKKGDDYYSFRFSLPDKEGVYHAARGTYNESHSSVRLDYNLKSTKYYPRYDEDSVTVTIDKITSSRISGTFSGILKLSDDTRAETYKNEVMITDGKFDIPFLKGNIRPE